MFLKVISFVFDHIASFFTGLCIDRVFQRLRSGTVRGFLGKNKPKDMVLTYAVLYPSGRDKCFHHMQRRSGEEINEVYSIWPAVSEAEVRCIAYLNSLCSQNNISVKIRSDEKTDNDYESNLISIGFACFKSLDILNDNFFVETDHIKYFRIKGNDCPFRRNKAHHYGIILRTTNESGNTRIVCGGFNEWGTSGAVSCLCRKYKLIIRYIRAMNPWYARFGSIPDFLAVTDGAVEADEKSQLVEVWVLNKYQMPWRVYPLDNSITHDSDSSDDDECLSSASAYDFCSTDCTSTENDLTFE